MIIGLTAAGMVSCSDDDDNSIKHDAEVIQFNVTVPRASRADITSTTSINNFKMWAFVEGKTYMNGVEVRRPPEGGNWTYTPIMYWPLGKDVNFYGISPADITTSEKPVGSEEHPDIPGFVNSNGLTDLLYSVNMKERETGRVQVNFRHALSQLQFQFRRVKRDENPIQVDVIGVEIVGANSVGDFKFPRATTLEGSVEEARGVWTNQNTPSIGTVYTGTAVTLDDKYKVIDNTGYALVIPQPLTFGSTSDTSNGTFVRIRCSIFDHKTGLKIWPGSSAEGYDDSTGTAYIYFPLRNENSSVTEWEPGKRYNYNVTVSVPDAGSSTIEFDVTVDSYGDFIDTAI